MHNLCLIINRMAKTHKVTKVKPCTSQLDEYISSLEGDDRKITARLAKALADCMSEHVTTC